jgi:hypothetical protein
LKIPYLRDVPATMKNVLRFLQVMKTKRIQCQGTRSVGIYQRSFFIPHLPSEHHEPRGYDVLAGNCSPAQ